MNTVHQAALFFLAQDEIDRIIPFGSGNVNDTYLVTLHSGGRRILQRLNPSVFPNPELVVHNTRLVTDHLLAAAACRTGSDSVYQPVRMFAGQKGDAWLDETGAAWRMLEMINGCRTLHSVSTEQQAGELGRCLGLFHTFLADMSPDTLADPLPGFHDTPGYLEQYDRVLSSSTIHTDHDIDFCRSVIEKHRPMADILKGCGTTLGHTIIHGDPKVANFLFDESGDRVVSLIDLDTVKAGLLLHDLGDALRSSCNRAGENLQSPEETVFDAPLFRSWLTGYSAVAGFLLTEEDRKRIVDAVLLITFELGLRFFTDFLAGNRYFKVSAERENLHRALVQFYLADSIAEQKTELNNLVITHCLRQ